MTPAMTPEDRRPRPRWVTVSVVLMYLGALVQITLGILTVFLRYLPESTADGTAFAITLVGAGIILLGLLVIALASGVARGSRRARLAATVLLLAAVALAVVDVIVTADGDWSGVAIQLGISAAVITPLWVGHGRAYFTRR
jgi:heme A synthase